MTRRTGPLLGLVVAVVVTAVQGLGGPFGTVLAGRFYEQADQVPSLVPAGDALGLATAGSVRLVDVPSGAPRWGRSYDEGAARGGLVGEAFVVLVGGTTAAVVSLDAGDGAPQGCVPVPNGLVAVDPRSGEVERLDSTEPIDQLLPVGEVVVLRTGRALLVVERRLLPPGRAGDV